MIEDKLDTDQRIRLESLNQANQSLVGSGAGESFILMRAEKFEKYIREGIDPDVAS